MTSKHGLHGLVRGREHPARALVVCALWLYLGLVGAAAVAIGIAELFDAETSRSAALLFCVSGTTLAAVSWQRGWAVLARAARAADVAIEGTRPTAMEGFTAGAQVTRFGHVTRYHAVPRTEPEP